MSRIFRLSFALMVAPFLVSVVSAQWMAPNTYFFPQTAAGTAGDLTMQTQFSVYNPTQNAAHIQMYFFKSWFGETLTLRTASPDDQKLTSEASSLNFELGARTRYVVNLSLASAAQAGWTKVISDTPLQISATYGAYRQLSAGQTVPLWEAAVLPAEPSHELSFPVHRMDGELAPGVDTNTGYGIANTSEWGSAHVTARLYNADGSLKGEREFEVRQHGHKAEFLTELFKDLTFNNFRGVLQFSSNAPIVVVALKESKNAENTVYSTVPVQSDSSFRSNTAYELEDNKLSTPHVISAPAEIRGTINANFDGSEQDNFAVDLTQGQTVQAILLTSFTGSPMAAELRIFAIGQSLSATGQPILPGSNDACVSYTAAAAGRHVIHVATSDNAFGRGLTYRLFVRVF